MQRRHCSLRHRLLNGEQRNIFKSFAVQLRQLTSTLEKSQSISCWYPLEVYFLKRQLVWLFSQGKRNHIWELWHFFWEMYLAATTMANSDSYSHHQEVHHLAALHHFHPSLPISRPRWSEARRRSKYHFPKLELPCIGHSSLYYRSTNYRAPNKCILHTPNPPPHTHLDPPSPASMPPIHQGCQITPSACSPLPTPAPQNVKRCKFSHSAPLSYSAMACCWVDWGENWWQTACQPKEAFPE